MCSTSSAVVDTINSNETATGTPLLTIAIPTYNRAAHLRELLELLVPQLIQERESDPGSGVELLLSDNASQDDTPAVIAWLQQQMEATGIVVRTIRHAENTGPDSNHIYCFNQAAGKYFWLVGDDDILRPGAIACLMGHLRTAEYDLVYVAAQGFYRDWQQEFRPDPYGRGAEVIRSPFAMMLRVNTGIAFITAMICNRERLLTLGAELPEAFQGTQLLHLSWLLPMLDQHRQSLCLWQRWVMGRSMNSSFDVAEIFGRRLPEVARRLLPRSPRLTRLLVNYTLRQWFPAMLLDMRQQAHAHDSYNLAEAAPVLLAACRRNLRYWLFMYPVLRFPLPMAKAWVRMAAVANHVMNTCLQPVDTLKKIAGRRQRSRTSPV